MSRHPGAGQAYVTNLGKRTYLGKFGTPAANERYSRFIAEVVASPAVKALRSATPPGGAITITELCAA